MSEVKEKVELQKPFWVIEVINKKGEAGLVIKTVSGIDLVIGGFDVKVTMFKNRSDANDCINKNKLFKMGKVRIVSGNEIAEKYGSVADGKKDLWIIKNEEGKYLKYSADKNVGYYFDEEKLGACMFDNILHLNGFIDHWQPEFKVSKLIPVLFNDDDKKKHNE